MKAYKGFDKDLKCRGFQYEIGKEYEEPKADLCACGFHACENPIDVFGYYNPADSRYCEVEISDISPKKSGDSKRCGKKIHIGAEIGIKGIVEAFIKFTMDKVDWKNAKESNTGDRSVATNTGSQSVATNTGSRSAATNTGHQSAATVKGEESIAIATGIASKAKGALGCYIVLAEWEWNGYYYNLKTVKTAKVDGKYIKEDTFYMLEDGEFVEVE